MVQTCCIKNCKERQHRGKDISFHKFPKNPELREKWIKAINRKDFEPSVHSRICSKHFEKDSFIGNTWSTKRNLKYDALPRLLKAPSAAPSAAPPTAPPEAPRTQPIEIVNIPCIKTEIESASSNNEFADDDGSFESVTDEDDVPFCEVPRRKKRTAYIGDILNSDMITDREKHAHIIGRTLTKKNRQIKTLQQTNRRLIRKVKELEGLVDELRKRSMDV